MKEWQESNKSIFAKNRHASMKITGNVLRGAVQRERRGESGRSHPIAETHEQEQNFDPVVSKDGKGLTVTIRLALRIIECRIDGGARSV